MRSMTVATCFLGVTVVACAQSALGWWLNSGSGIATVMGSLFVVAILLGIRTHSLPVVLADVAGFWIGCVSGATAILAWTGPGTIWPIVVVVGASLMTMAITIGLVVGRAAEYGLRQLTGGTDGDRLGESGIKGRSSSGGGRRVPH